MTAMITIDDAGQIHLPEPLKRVFGLRPGIRVQAQVTPGKIEIVPDATETSEGAMEKVVLPAPKIIRPDFLARQKALFGNTEVADSLSILDELRGERF